MGWCVPSWMFEWHSCETWVNVGQKNILTWFLSDQIVLYKWWWIVCLNNGKQTNTSFRGKLITVCTPWVINQATLHESLALKVTPNKTRHACQWQHIPACKLIWLNMTKPSPVRKGALQPTKHRKTGRSTDFRPTFAASAEPSSLFPCRTCAS